MTDESSTIPKGWKLTTLGEVATIKGGKRLPKNKSLITFKTNHPYIRITDIENNQIKKNQLLFVPDEVFTSISRYIVNSGDVIVSIVGSIGFVALIDDDLDNASLTENCVKLVNLKNLDSKFLYYYLISKLGQDEIIKNSVGAVQKKLPIYGVQNIQILLSSQPEQFAIASVLSVLDDKIKLLREQNKTLEELAHTLFIEWFVKFNFPSNTGKMKNSEIGKIPEGWQICKIKDFGDVICGKTPSKANPNFFGGNIPFIKIPDMHGEVFINSTQDYLSETGAETQSNKFIPPNSICVSCIATVGLVSITSEKSQTNQQINSIVPSKDFYLEYLFFSLKNIKDFLISLGAGGSATLNINTSTFANIKLIMPDDTSLKKFHSVASPIIQKINFNNSSIINLAKLRDTLLPKLLTGETRVKGFN